MLQKIREGWERNPQNLLPENGSLLLRNTLNQLRYLLENIPKEGESTEAHLCSTYNNPVSKIGSNCILVQRCICVFI